MSLKWIDTLDIAIELAEQHDDVDPRYIRFTDLHTWVFVRMPTLISFLINHFNALFKVD
jgi:Fe-S-cluster formation regulator IscX/YfhJ